VSRLGLTAAEMVETSAALDAAMKLADDPYAPRGAGEMTFVADPYWSADDEDFRAYPESADGSR